MPTKVLLHFPRKQFRSDFFISQSKHIFNERFWFIIMLSAICNVLSDYWIENVHCHNILITAAVNNISAVS